MKKKEFLLSIMVLVIALMAIIVQASIIPDAIWCDGRLFGVTVTPKDVPLKGPFDKLYNFAEELSGLEGQRSVSESCPGDRDYNGGRWEVLPVAYTETGMEEFDPDGDGMVNYELTSDMEVLQNADLGYLTIGDPIRYFLCPLHLQKD
jgi:hypothetical protein